MSFFPTLARYAAKRTTGLVGVPVVENARDVLMDVYRKTLEEMAVRSVRSPSRTISPPPACAEG